MATSMEEKIAQLKAKRAQLQELIELKRAVQAEQFATPGDLAKYTWPAVRQTPALELLDQHLVKAANGEIDRLAWSMPPQEGKSMRIARTFPLWVLLRNPDTRIAIVSFEFGVARRWGGMIRHDIEAHPELGLTTTRGRNAAHDFQIDGHLGGIYCVGVGGSLTGRPVDLMIIDDPIKGEAEAASEVIREKTWSWWQSTASTRLAPGAPVVLDQTRWHQDDLLGRMLAEYPGEWTYINIPALADHDPNQGEVDVLGREPGEWMLSARTMKDPKTGKSTGEPRTIESWEQRRREVGSRSFIAMYQGRPSPAEGGIFKRDWWQVYNLPKAVQLEDGTWKALGATQVIASWDMTFKDTKGSDYVVGQIWARRGANIWLLDQVRGQWDFTRTCQEVEFLHYKWPQALLTLVEDKANGPAVLSQLRSRVPGMVPVTPKDSKLARASAIAPLVEAGNVGIPHISLAPWSKDFIEECATFPNATHDDQVDAMSQALSRLMIGGSDMEDFMSQLTKEHGV